MSVKESVKEPPQGLGELQGAFRETIQSGNYEALKSIQGYFEKDLLKNLLIDLNLNLLSGAFQEANKHFKKPFMENYPTKSLK